VALLAEPPQVKAALAGALYPNVAVMEEGAKMGRPGWSDGVAEVALHPASVLHPLEAPRFTRPFLVYLEKVFVQLDAPKTMVTHSAAPACIKQLAGCGHLPGHWALGTANEDVPAPAARQLLCHLPPAWRKEGMEGMEGVEGMEAEAWHVTFGTSVEVTT